MVVFDEFHQCKNKRSAVSAFCTFMFDLLFRKHEYHH